MEVLSLSSYGWIVRVAIMVGGNEILDKIVHLTTHTTRIKADATVNRVNWLTINMHRAQSGRSIAELSNNIFRSRKMIGVVKILPACVMTHVIVGFSGRFKLTVELSDLKISIFFLIKNSFL